MPVFAGLIVTLVTQALAFIGINLARKTALIVAALALLSTIAVGLGVALAAIVQPLLTSFPGVALGVWLFVPDNAAVCVAAALSADAAVAVANMWRSNVVLAGQIAA